MPNPTPNIFAVAAEALEQRENTWRAMVTEAAQGGWPELAERQAELATTRDALARFELFAAADLHDVRTHRSAWRGALESCLAAPVLCDCYPDDTHICTCSSDQRSYYEHELGAFDRTFDLLESLLFAEVA